MRDKKLEKTVEVLWSNYLKANEVFCAAIVSRVSDEVKKKAEEERDQSLEVWRCAYFQWDEGVRLQ